MPSQAKALGNARDMQTRRGRVFGQARVLEKGQGFMAHVLGRSESQLPQGCICPAALSGNALSRTNDKAPNIQEPCDSKEARTVLKQRWEWRRSHRL